MADSLTQVQLESKATPASLGKQDQLGSLEPQVIGVVNTGLYKHKPEVHYKLTDFCYFDLTQQLRS
jgi:hypothetical protein